LKSLRMLIALLVLAPSLLWAQGGDNLWLGWMTLFKAKHRQVPVAGIFVLAPETNRIRRKQIPIPEWKIKEIEDKVGPLSEEERIIIAYEIKKDGPLRPKKKFGFVIFFRLARPTGELEMAMQIDQQGKLLGVSAISYPQGESALDVQFWSQLSQKTLQDPWEIGKDLKAPNGQEELAQAVSASSKRSLLLALSALRLTE
jgi:hypothetical protein